MSWIVFNRFSRLQTKLGATAIININRSIIEENCLHTVETFLVAEIVYTLCRQLRRRQSEKVFYLTTKNAKRFRKGRNCLKTSFYNLRSLRVKNSYRSGHKKGEQKK